MVIRCAPFLTIITFVESVRFLKLSITSKMSAFATGNRITLYAFTLNASYLETLPANTYVTLLLTFDDAAATTLSVTIAVGGANA